MRYSKSALGLLNAQYRSVLKKCALINLGLMIFAVPAMATDVSGVTVSDMSGYSSSLYTNSGSPLNISNSVFENNAMSAGGVGGIVTGYRNGPDVTVDSSTFKGNKANEIGVMWLLSNTTITNSVFEGNASLNTKVGDIYYDGGGSLFFGSDSATAIDNTSFTGNTSGTDGGALASRRFSRGNNTNAKLDINGSTFAKNTAAVAGGAIDNYLYNSKANSGFVSVKNSTFSENSAGNGGAIYNHAGSGSDVKVGGEYQKAAIWSENNTFSGNIAAGKGGAIYNESNMVLAGTNKFEGNKDATGLNDIYNSGTLYVMDNLSLDGGISGAGTLNVASGTKLTVKTDVTTISNAIINNGADLNIIVENGRADGEYKLVTGSLDNEFKYNVSNTLYNITADESNKGTYLISKKATEEIAEELDTSSNTASAIEAITSAEATDNAEFQAVADTINEYLQSGDAEKVAAATEAVKAVSAEESPMVTSSQTENANQIFGAITSRMSSSSSSGNQGIASGDEDNGAVWLQTLYNKAHMSDNKTKKLDGFESTSYGVAMGVEKTFTDDILLGVGYGYTDSKIKPSSRKVDADTHTAFIYGEYKPSNWFINSAVSYGWSKYKESKNILGTAASGKYDVDTFAVQAMTGYDFHVNGAVLTPETGLRYIHVKQDAYKDSLGTSFSEDKSDLLTGVLGARLSKKFYLQDCVTLIPEARAAMTYDLKNDAANSNVSLANGVSYVVNGSSLKRFGGEFGLGMTAEFGDEFELSARYEARVRSKYYDNTGMISAKYKF